MDSGPTPKGVSRNDGAFFLAPIIAYKTASGPMPLIGTDPEARADAFPRVLDFLKLHLEQN
jgi:hypothetical protein